MKEELKRIILLLEGFGHRGSATENEAKAADYLVKELEEVSTDVSKQEFRGYCAFGSRVLIHVVVAFIGLMFLNSLPLITVLTGAIASFSFVTEMSTKGLLLSRLIPSSSSRNVIARIKPTSEILRRVVICAHYDTQRTGWIWINGVAKSASRVFNKLPSILKSPAFFVSFSFTVQPILGLLTISSLAAPLALVLYKICLVTYLVSGVLLFQWSRGKFVPGASDNASGVAAAIVLAKRWKDNAPSENTELIILLSGCEETGALGAAAWLDECGRQLNPETTFFVIADTFGCDSPKIISEEVSLASVPSRYPVELVSMCYEKANEMKIPNPAPLSIPVFSDGLAFLNRGYKGVFISSLTSGGYFENYHLPSDNSENLNLDACFHTTEFTWEVIKEWLARY